MQLAASCRAEAQAPAKALADVNTTYFATCDLRLDRLLRLGRQQTRWIAAITVIERDGDTPRDGETHDDVRLGTTTEFTTQGKFRRAVYEATGRWLDKQEGGTWEKTTTRLHAASELRDHESSDREQARAWIAHFITHHEPAVVDLDEVDDRLKLLAADWRPDCFRERTDGNGRRLDAKEAAISGRLYVALQPLANHVRMQLARTTQVDLATNLRALDFEPQQLTQRGKKRVHKARYWRAPAGFDPDEG
ncbi:hypothetical protein [Candidatus Solirubrobacter pratensis]|uniref:hypothetical protein n=1 Tax=Candidatus Solirubrobacter pratensis TaxID=1298857 RepID=UPI0012DD2776|nr:hypothetical protein [Candidatus Solirubrobacter pratensis]